MNLANLIVLSIKVSVILLVLSIGLRASFSDALSLFKQPAKLLRSLLAMDVIMPLFALMVVMIFNLHPAVKITLVALALSPIPPILPIKQRKLGGPASHAIGLLVAAGLLSIVIIPVALELLEKFLNLPLQLSVAVIVKLVFITVTLPLSAGILLKHFASAFAEKIADPLAKIAGFLLIVCVLIILIKEGSVMISLLGDGTLLAMLAFIFVGLVAGNLLGGPLPEERTNLALATATRHPGIAMAIAHENFPDQKLVPAAILLYLLLNVIIGIAYGYWCRKKNKGSEV